MESAPVFVKVSKYKELAAILQKIEERLETTNKTLVQLEKIREEEEQQIAEWKDHVQTVREKLDTVSVALHQKK